MDKIKTVKIKNPDGSVSEETYTISVDARNVDMDNSKDLQETIGTIDIDTDGNIAEQLENLNDNVDDLNIDIKKKAYFFNTVTDMKNADLKVGDYVCTLGYYEVNDGGQATYFINNNPNLIVDNGSVHVLSNGLKAQLIHGKEIFYRVFGDIEDALSYAIAHPAYIIKFDDITINQSLNLPANLNLVFEKIIYTGSDYAINIIDGLYGNINIKQIVSNNGGGINFITNSTYIGRLKLNIDIISSKLRCINFTNSRGIFDCYISGKAYTSQNENCIYINSNQGYVGQLDFNIKRLEAINNYAIFISSLDGSFTGANFNYCSLEGSKKGIYLDFTSDKSFEKLSGDFRVMELTDTVLKIKGNMTYLQSDIYFTFDRIRYNLIDVSEITWQTIATATIYINGHIVGSSGNNEIGSKAMIKRDYVALIDFPEQFEIMRANIPAWSGTRPVTYYQVDNSLSVETRLYFRIPSWVCPENGKHIRIKLNGKNTTISSPKGKWLHEYNAETGTLDIYAQVQGTTIQFNAYLDGVLSWSLYEQD